MDDIGEKIKQGKSGGGEDKKNEGKTEAKGSKKESDKKGNEGRVGSLEYKKAAPLSKGKTSSRSEKGLGSSVDLNKKIEGGSAKKNTKSQKDSKDKSRWDDDKDDENDNNNKYRKGGKGGKGGDDVSHLVRVSGRKGKHGKASILSGTKKRHGSQSTYRRHSSRIRNGIKGSKFIYDDRRSHYIQRPSRGDEVRTCDILRVHLEQRDLIRWYALQFVELSVLTKIFFVVVPLPAMSIQCLRNLYAVFTFLLLSSLQNFYSNSNICCKSLIYTDIILLYFGCSIVIGYVLNL